MNNIIEFFINHWILSAVFLLILVALLVNEWMMRTMGLPKVEPKEAVDLMNHSEAHVFDIRSQTAFSDGHILGALHLPMSHLGSKIKSFEKYKDKPVIVVCNLGQSAVEAGKVLQQHGFSQIYILNGGIQGWRAAGLLLTKK